MKKWMTALAFVVSVMLLLSACSQSGSSTPASSSTSGDDSLQKLKDKGTVVIGGTTTGPPFSFLTSKNENDGLMYDIAKRVVEEMGLKSKTEGMLYANIIPALEAGKIDMISCGCVITEEKKQVMNFTDVVYKISEGFVVKSDNTTIKTLEDLKSKKVAASAGGLYYNNLKKMEGVEVVTYKSTQDMVTELENGRIDAFFQDKPIILYLIKQNPQLKIKLVEGYQSQWIGEVGLGLPKGADSLTQEVNKVIKKLQENGEIDSIIRKWDL